MAAQSSDPGRNPLSIAINNVSHEKLRSLFIAICEKVPEARQQAQSELLIETDSVPIGDNEEQEPEPEARIRYADCANCKKEFDTTKNLEISCRYHPSMFFLHRFGLNSIELMVYEQSARSRQRRCMSTTMMSLRSILRK